jgi:hypothetical protein
MVEKNETAIAENITNSDCERICKKLMKVAKQDESFKTVTLAEDKLHVSISTEDANIDVSFDGSIGKKGGWYIAISKSAGIVYDHTAIQEEFDGLNNGAIANALLDFAKRQLENLKTE